MKPFCLPNELVKLLLLFAAWTGVGIAQIPAAVLLSNGDFENSAEFDNTTYAAGAASATLQELSGLTGWVTTGNRSWEVGEAGGNHYAGTTVSTQFVGRNFVQVVQDDAETAGEYLLEFDLDTVDFVSGEVLTAFVFGANEDLSDLEFRDSPSELFADFAPGDGVMIAEFEFAFDTSGTTSGYERQTVPVDFAGTGYEYVGIGFYQNLVTSPVDRRNDVDVRIDNVSFSPVPEPTTLSALLGSVALYLGIGRRRRAR